VGTYSTIMIFGSNLAITYLFVIMVNQYILYRLLKNDLCIYKVIFLTKVY